jgi:hypothetical protein
MTHAATVPIRRGLVVDTDTSCMSVLIKVEQNTRSVPAATSVAGRDDHERRRRAAWRTAWRRAAWRAAAGVR